PALAPATVAGARADPGALRGGGRARRPGRGAQAARERALLGWSAAVRGGRARGVGAPEVEPRHARLTTIEMPQARPEATSSSGLTSVEPKTARSRPVKASRSPARSEAGLPRVRTLAPWQPHSPSAGLPSAT